MRAFKIWWPSSLFFLVFRLSLAASIFVPEGLGYYDDSLISSNFEDEISDFGDLNPDSTLLSKSDECAGNDATKSRRKRNPNPAWCTTDEKTPSQQPSSPPKGQQQDRSGWTDNKPFEGELPSQLRFLEEEPRLMAEPKPSKELCKDRGLFAVCAEDKSVGWWGQPDSMQFKLDPCTPFLPVPRIRVPTKRPETSNPTFTEWGPYVKRKEKSRWRKNRISHILQEAEEIFPRKDGEKLTSSHTG